MRMRSLSRSTRPSAPMRTASSSRATLVTWPSRWSGRRRGPETSGARRSIPRKRRTMTRPVLSHRARSSRWSRSAPHAQAVPRASVPPRSMSSPLPRGSNPGGTTSRAPGMRLPPIPNARCSRRWDWASPRRRTRGTGCVRSSQYSARPTSCPRRRARGSPSRSRQASVASAWRRNSMRCAVPAIRASAISPRSLWPVSRPRERGALMASIRCAPLPAPESGRSPYHPSGPTLPRPDLHRSWVQTSSVQPACAAAQPAFTAPLRGAADYRRLAGKAPES